MNLDLQSYNKYIIINTKLVVNNWNLKDPTVFNSLSISSWVLQLGFQLKLVLESFTQLVTENFKK